MADNVPEDSRSCVTDTVISEEQDETELPSCMTLESIIDLTDEMGHLNELVLLHLDKGGGFSCPASYFTTVQPILDLLEVEIRLHYRAGMHRSALKRIIQNWIDEEISSLQ